jgi:phospholipid-binding lipoprotein MlaA
MRLSAVLTLVLLVLYPFYGPHAVEGDKSVTIQENTSDDDFLTEEDFDLVDENTYAIDDPFEDFNRIMFSINKGLDTIIFKPVAMVYRHTIPEPGRDRVDSALANLKEPINFTNSILQGDPASASTSLGRFLVNSLLGLGGLFDVATEAGITPTYKDFDSTLRRYDITTGPYIYLPIIGPSSPRGMIGLAGDYGMDPFIYLMHKDALYVRDGIRLVNTRESLLEFTDDIEKTYIDEYATMRSIYAQKRKAKK